MSNDNLSFAAERAITYIKELQREIHYLERASDQVEMKRVRDECRELEKKIMDLQRENRTLNLKLAEIGMELGKSLNARLGSVSSGSRFVPWNGDIPPKEVE